MIHDTSTTAATPTPTPITHAGRRRKHDAARRRRWHRDHPLQAAIASSFDGSSFAWGHDRGHYGIASRTLAHHTKVRLCYSGCITAEVVDRGPYIYDRLFDLLPEAKAAISCTDLCAVHWRLAFPG